MQNEMIAKKQGTDDEAVNRLHRWRRCFNYYRYRHIKNFPYFPVMISISIEVIISIYFKTFSAISPH